MHTRAGCDRSCLVGCAGPLDGNSDGLAIAGISRDLWRVKALELAAPNKPSARRGAINTCQRARKADAGCWLRASSRTTELKLLSSCALSASNVSSLDNMLGTSAGTIELDRFIIKLDPRSSALVRAAMTSSIGTNQS